MKKIITILFCLLAVQCTAIQILWFGVDENARIHKGDDIYTWVGFSELIGQDMANIAIRAIFDGNICLVGFTIEDEPLPPGQGAPTIHFDDDIQEVPIAMTDDDWNWTGEYGDYSSLSLGKNCDEIDKSASIIFELGYWEDDGWGDFVPLAVTDPIEIGSIWEYTYPSGDLGPPSATSYKPTDFYMPVPEPSTVHLCLLGLIMFSLMRRK